MNIPIIGICAGMQWMNIWAGGTLVQHLPHVMNWHKVNGESNPDAPVHPVKIENIMIPGSDEILFSERVIHTTSRHHQAVGIIDIKKAQWYKTKDKRNREGLGVNVAPVGFSIEQDSKGNEIGSLSVVEVIVNFDANMLGVQYHPESNMCDDTLELIQNFINYVQVKTSVETSLAPVAEAITV
jgi:gamma-glutamyl-gamma-aminobutyrate hydrolase PuuD